MVVAPHPPGGRRAFGLAGFSRRGFSRRGAPQCRAVRSRWAARARGHAADRAHHGGDPRPGRELQESALPVPDFHDAEFVRNGHRSSPRRHRRLQQHDLLRLSGRARGRQRDALHRERCRSRRHRRALRRQFRERGHDPEGRARQGFRHRGRRQGRPHADVRPFGAQRRAHDRGRRSHRHAHRHPPLRLHAGRAQGRRPAARRPVARRQRQGRRFSDAGRQGRQRDAAGLVRAGRRQGGAAAAQGPQPTLRAGLLVARSRRHPA